MESSPPASRRRSGSLLFDYSSKSSNKASAEGKAQPEDRSGSETSAGRPSSDDLEMAEMHSDDSHLLTDDEETGLTHAERKKRRRQRDQNQQLDERIAPTGETGDDFKKAEDRLTRATLVKNLVINALLIGLWYSFSISISVYNKWMFSPGNLDFHFPLFTTSIHMVVQFLLASSVLLIFPRFRPSNGVLPNSDSHGTYKRVGDSDTDPQEQLPPKKKPPLMTSSFYLTRITPCGTATALDIGLGNFSLRFITLTFFTMCKSSVLAFVLIFAFLFRLEKPTWKLCAIIALMTIGVIMMVAGEAAFNALGFMLVMTASFCSGFRWSLTQILLLRNPATSNPFSSIFFLTPSMFLILFILALPIEGIPSVIAALGTLSEQKGTFLSIIIMLFPGVLAFMMVAAEFALLKRTSVVTLSVCGIFKEVLTISAASMAFGDPLSPINVSGLIVTIVSIAGYNWLKYRKMKSEAVKEAHDIMNDSTGAGSEGREDGGPTLDEDAFEIGRESTSTIGLMRDSLSLPTDVDRGNYGSGNAQSHGPHKRPEDLE